MTSKIKAAVAYLAFSAAAFGIFLYAGHGAFVTCADTIGDLDCYLRKRTFFSEKEDKFTRSEITAVSLSVATYKSQNRKTTEDYWDIRMQNNRELPVTLKGVAWPMGNMNLASLRELLLKPKQPLAHTTLRMVSFGLAPWFAGLLAAAIGWALFIVAFAKPVTNVSTAELQRARVANGFMFLAISGITTAGWIFFFKIAQKYLAG